MHAQFHWLAKMTSTEDVYKSVRLKKNTSGFGISFDHEKIIRVIDEDSVAFHSDLEVGDRIMCINGFECQSVEDIIHLASTQSTIILSVGKTTA